MKIEIRNDSGIGHKTTVDVITDTGERVNLNDVGITGVEISKLTPHDIIQAQITVLRPDLILNFEDFVFQGTKNIEFRNRRHMELNAAEIKKHKLPRIL